MCVCVCVCVCDSVRKGHICMEVREGIGRQNIGFVLGGSELLQCSGLSLIFCSFHTGFSSFP